MRTSTILPLAVGLMVAACGDGGGPSTDGTLVVSTSTGGSDPDQDGYLLTVDGLASLSLDPTGTAEVRLPSGQHTLRLVGVAEHCSVAPGTSLEMDVPSQGTVSVAFDVSCPATAQASAILRITAPTTGPIPRSTRYSVWYEHYGYWDYGGTSTFLGALDPNGTLVAEVAASSESGADPYWYFFQLRDIPANCSVQDPHPYLAPGFKIMPGDTLDVEFVVACLP